MTAHLLNLATLHNAAPGVLDVVFGPDGDFEGAPPWLPWLWIPGRQIWIQPVDVRDIKAAVMRETVTLDCRVYHIEAHIAGLCARALGESGVGWRIDATDTCWTLTDGMPAFKWPKDGSSYGKALSDIPVVSGAPWADKAVFLAALTLALAPRIATLGSTK